MAVTERRHKDTFDVRLALICDLNAVRDITSTVVMRSVLFENIPEKINKKSFRYM
jgi:hypothetical protein